MLRYVSLAAAILLNALLAHAAWSAHVTVTDVERLDSACEAARAAALAPEREAAIAACIAAGGRDAAACRQFYRDFGQAHRQGERAVPGRYYELPACRAAFEADKHLRLDP